MGKKSARDARGGERESNCGAAGRRACPRSLRCLGSTTIGLAEAELCDAGGAASDRARLRCGTTCQPNLRRNGPPRPDEPGESFLIGGVVAGTGAKEPWWAVGAATWAEIADDVEGTMVAAAHRLGACFGVAEGVEMSGATTVVMTVG